MDSTQFAPGAGAPPSAADPSSFVPSTGIGASDTGVIPIQEAVTPVAGAITPIPDAGAPGAAATPSSTTTSPATPAAPQWSPDEVTRWQQESRQFQQLQQEIRQYAAEQQRAQAEAEATRQAEDRIATIYQTAENMEPQAAFAYIRQQEGIERARLRGEINQIRQQSQQQLYQALAQASAPLYAQHLVKEHNLPPAYADMLTMLSPQQMDAYVPVLVQQHQMNQQVEQRLHQTLAELDQFKRSQQAGQIAAQGIQTGAAAGVSPVPSNPNGNVRAGSADHLLSIPGVASLFGLRPAGG